MKLALACDWFLPRLGGIEIHLRDLARRLREAGHEVRVVTSTPGAPEVDGIPVHRIDAPLFPGAGFVCTPGAFRAIEAVLRAERFDLVHAHASIVSPTAYGTALLAARSGTPAVVTFHSVLRNHAWWLRPAVHLLGVPARQLAFTGVSGVVAREASALLGGREVAVLSNAIEPDEWRVRPVPRTDGVVRIVSVMRLAPKKRPRALLHVIARVRALAPEAKLHVQVVGDGPELPALRRLATHLGLGDVVELSGRRTREEIRAIHARSDVFVLPTILEAFGIAALEARAAGVPVVVRREAGIAELLEEGEDSLLATSDEEMARCIARLATDTALRTRLTEHARTTAPPASWAAVTARHVALYERVMASSGRAAAGAAAG